MQRDVATIYIDFINKQQYVYFIRWCIATTIKQSGDRNVKIYYLFLIVTGLLRTINTDGNQDNEFINTDKSNILIVLLDRWMLLNLLNRRTALFVCVICKGKCFKS